MSITEAPPFGVLSEEVQNDPLPALAYYRQHQPVFLATDFPVYVLCRYQDVLGMRDQDIYSTQFIKAIREPIDGPNVMQLDKDEHKRNRSIVGTGFRPRVINRFAETVVSQIVDELLDTLGNKGAADLNPEFCDKVPFRSIAVLIGLTVDDEETLAEIYRDQVAYTPLQADEATFARSIAAREKLTELLRPAVERVMASSDDSFLSTVINARSKGGDALNEEEIYGFLRFLLPAGLETTYSSLSNALYQFISRPALYERLCANPGLIPNAIEESLRWHAPIPYINRVTLQPTTVSGVDIPEGSLVLGSTIGANHDPEVFPDPERFDIDRESNQHIAFGVGVHTCLGAPLARATLKTAIPKVLERLPGLRLRNGFEGRFSGVFDNRLTELPVEWS